MKNNHRALFLAIIGASVSLTAHAAPQGFEWFPRVPGPGDQLYLIAVDPCHSASMYGAEIQEASFIYPESESLHIEYGSGLALCNSAPPRIDAYEIPREVDGIPVKRLSSTHVQRRDHYEGGTLIETTYDETDWLEYLPATVAVPPSVAGTWFSSSHAEQGLIINMTAKRELSIGWTTYGADGKQRWFSGIAPTVHGESSVVVKLIDTGDGAFAGQLPNDAPFKEWGSLTIKYVACGKIEASWNPKPETGLKSGTATMLQLTQPHDAACNLKNYAAELGQGLTIHELEIDNGPVSGD